MKQGTVWAVWFSPTGTTQAITCHIARHIAETLGKPFRRFDFTPPAARQGEMAFGADDIVVLGVPVYAGRVPNVLLKYLNMIQGGGAFGVPIVLFGNRNYDDALIELRNIMEQEGFHTVAAAAFVGEHSFSEILAAGRPDAADYAVASEFAARVAAVLGNEAAASPVPVAGHEPIRPYYTPRDRAGNPIDIRKVRPKVGPGCTSCGLCAMVCPMGSIDPADMEHALGICIKCGACSKRCPTGARYYDDAGYLYHKQELEEQFTRRAEPELFLVRRGE